MTIVLWLVKGNNNTLINLLIVSTGIHATITFPHDTEQCLGQLVEYQCTVDGTILNWRVFNESQVQLSDGFNTYTSGGISPPSTIGKGVFTIEQLQQSPVVSTISFTVQSNINGYTIQCEDGGTMTNENLIINITGMSISKIINVNFFYNQSLHTLVYMCVITVLCALPKFACTNAHVEY